MTRHTRRDFLAAAGTASLTAIAGCSDEDESTAEADEPAQNDTQESTEDAEDEEDEDKRPEPLKHRVEFEVVDEESRPQEGVVIHAELRDPIAQSPPTDATGRTVVEIPSGVRVNLHAVDSDGERYSVKVLHAEPDHERTGANGLVVLDETFVRVEMWRGEPVEVSSP